MQVSTTHSIVGGVVGVTAFGVGMNYRIANTPLHINMLYRFRLPQLGIPRRSSRNCGVLGHISALCGSHRRDCIHYFGWKCDQSKKYSVSIKNGLCNLHHCIHILDGFYSLLKGERHQRRVQVWKSLLGGERTILILVVHVLTHPIFKVGIGCCWKCIDCVHCSTKGDAPQS